jgi:hypothetical protein
VRGRITVYSHLARPETGAPAVSLGLGLSAPVEGRAYGIAAKVSLSPDKTVTREAVILLTGDRTRPFLTLAWR